MDKEARNCEEAKESPLADELNKDKDEVLAQKITKLKGRIGKLTDMSVGTRKLVDKTVNKIDGIPEVGETEEDLPQPNGLLEEMHQDLNVIEASLSSIKIDMKLL